MPKYPIQPSFRYKVREALRESRFFKSKKWFDPIMSLDVKDAAYKFCENNNIPTPKLYKTNFKLEDFPFNESLESLVLKPLYSHSSFGVFLLSKNNNNTYNNLIDNKQGDLRYFLSQAEEEMVNKNFSNNWMLEELLLPLDSNNLSVDDWKFYTFYGKCPLILQKHRTQTGNIEYQWYDQNWKVVKNTGRYRNAINPDLTPPQLAEELLLLAKKISSLIPTSFMRIDLFETSRGPVLGEFTPFPGGFSMFHDAYNKLLGEYWLEAESRLHWEYKIGEANKKINNIRATIK